MNVYQKLAKARAMLKAEGLKQSGNNKFAGYTYFELGDFLPSITKIEMGVGILSCVTFGKEEATLTVYNTDEGKEAEKIVFTTPMSTAQLKGCHEVQNLGAVETYIRRYLYNTAYEIVECDALNATSGKDENKPENKPVKAKKSEPVQTNEEQSNGAPKAEQKPVQSVAKLTLGEIVKLGFKNSARVATWLCNQYGVENLSDLSDEETEEARAFIQKRAQKAQEAAKALQDADGDIPFPMEG